MIKHRSRWVVTILAITCTGLGQVYNGQFLKGVLFFAAELFTGGLLYHFGVATSFYGFIVSLTAFGLILLVVLIDVLKNAGHAVTLKWYNKWHLYLLVFIVSLVTRWGFNYGLGKADVFSNNYLGVDSYKMSAGSMTPTIAPGAKLIADKRRVTRQNIRHGDLIVFLYPPDKTKLLIKRVIGLPGDRIRTEGTDLYVNGEKMAHTVINSDTSLYSEAVGDHHYSVLYLPDHAYSDQEYVVPEGQLFVVGDNRDMSADSRAWGFLPIENVVGKAMFIYWSSDPSSIGKSLITR